MLLAKSEGTGLQINGTIMATNGDLKAHEQTYSGFTALLKWGTVASAIVTVIVIFLIAN
jgi:hypothetical protein